MEIDERPIHTQKGFHLAGIVPIAGQPLDFQMDWPDCMMPVAPDYTMIEAAIHECLWAGCDTIWIVCNDDLAPLVRYRLGDYGEDPVWASRKFSPNPREQRKQIPFFYVPIHPKDRDRRDCLAWSVIHGALTCLKTVNNISKWLIPDKYYVSFPYGIFNPEELRPLRQKIATMQNFYISNKGETVENNHYCSFTFGKEEFIKYRRIIRKEGTGLYTSEVVDERGIPRSKLPIEERWSARFFELERVFRELDLKESIVFEPTWYHNLGSWKEYKNFLSSEDSKDLKRPWERILRYREFNPIGVDEEG